LDNLIHHARSGPTVRIRYMLVYPPSGAVYVCLGDTVKNDGRVIPWHSYEPGCGFAEEIAAELAAAFPVPPRDAPDGYGELLVGIEVRLYEPLGRRVLRTFLSRRSSPPVLPAYSGPVR
jgi:hypothetical protein